MLCKDNIISLPDEGWGAAAQRQRTTVGGRVDRQRHQPRSASPETPRRQDHTSRPDPTRAGGAPHPAHEGPRDCQRRPLVSRRSRRPAQRECLRPRMEEGPRDGPDRGPATLTTRRTSIRPAPRWRHPRATAGSRLRRSHAGLAAAWTYCCGSTQAVSMSTRRYGTSASIVHSQTTMTTRSMGPDRDPQQPWPGHRRCSGVLSKPSGTDPVDARSQSSGRRAPPRVILKTALICAPLSMTTV